jgi:flavin reductase (DIM6/NTAB) family NADH-FMN oxidoreductase RutF
MARRERSVVATSAYLSGSVVESPVGILLTEAGDRRNAMTISFFSEVAHHPTTLWISVAQGGYSGELLDASGRFTLVVLHAGQRQLAWQCGTTSGRDGDKFSKLRTHRGPEDYLYLDDSLAGAACRVRSSRPAGEHILYIADIVGGESETRNSLKRTLITRDLL